VTDRSARLSGAVKPGPTRRIVRCEHLMPPGQCVIASCKHWDRKRESISELDDKMSRVDRRRAK